MFPTAENEAGPSTTTRTLRSRSPVKLSSAPLIRTSRTRPTIQATESPLAETNTSQSRQRVTSPSTSSSRTITSGPGLPLDLSSSLDPASSPITISRPRKTYSRQSRPLTPMDGIIPAHSLQLPPPSFLHPNYIPTSPTGLLDSHSRSSSPLSSPSKTPAKSSPMPPTSNSRKGKGRAAPATVPRAERKPANLARVRAPRSSVTNATKAMEKRVLPARIRRAAGTGADGIRDLEEMVVDWLERWGEPLDSPPDTMVIHLTTLPLSLVSPPLLLADISATAPVPPPAGLSGQPNLSAKTPSETRHRIEVPSWHKVKPGQDDEEEAKDELQTMRFTQRAGRGSTSPVKRLRHATTETPLEDTSDAYYIALHKKYEVFERRQRIREKETLQFERYKMRSRIDLLRGMSKTAWTALVGVVLSRSAFGPVAPVIKRVLKMGEVEKEVEVVIPKDGEGAPVDRWAKGRIKIEQEGPDWLRDKLVNEGEELMRRYDELLPPEHRKSRITDMSPAPTTSYSPSLSPPPVIPHRVAALRDPPVSAPVHRRHTSSGNTAPRRITLTLKARSTPSRQAAESAHASEGNGRKRKRAAGAEGSQRRTRSRDAGAALSSAPNKERRASLRSSTPAQDNIQIDEEMEDEEEEEEEVEEEEEELEMRDDEEMGGEESESEVEMASETDGNHTPAPTHTISIVKSASAPISIRISRSSGTPSLVASPRAAVGPVPGTTRSSRSRALINDGRQDADARGIEEGLVKRRLGNPTADEAKELREVEAAVL